MNGRFQSCKTLKAMNIILFENEIDEFGNGVIPSSMHAYDHILNVLRSSEGDEFKCGIWGRSRGIGVIKSVSEAGIDFSYRENDVGLSGLELYLMMSYIRPICARRVMRFIGEAAVSGIVFVPTALTEKSYMNSSFYTKGECIEILKQGCEISGGAFRPEVVLAKSFSEGLEYFDDKGIANRYLLEKSDSSEKLHRPEFGASVLAIGCERGWVKDEVSAFLDRGFVIRNLGKRILRSEESAIVSVFPWL
ncbi:MAG TPA: hypothetical protein DCO86_04520 [Spirochaetaceae bacterium]|nr:hypothetical protein [Spirochaetaceae bacterium]